MKYPRVKIQSDAVYKTILRNLCDTCNESGCRDCVVKDTRSGADWLRSMGININVLLWGSVVPKGISKFIIDRRFRRNTSYVTHPLIVLWATVATGTSILLVLKFIGIIQ